MVVICGTGANRRTLDRCARCGSGGGGGDGGGEKVVHLTDVRGAVVVVVVVMVMVARRWRPRWRYDLGRHGEKKRLWDGCSL